MKAHPALTEEHEAFRETMRRFVGREIVPHVNAPSASIARSR
ncbi:MAG: hypothetical protein ACREVG_15560 [Burkholderiales bacterium]